MRILLSLILFLLVPTLTHAWSLAAGYQFWTNVTVTPGTVLADYVNTSDPVIVYVMHQSQYQTYAHGGPYTPLYNKTLGTGTYVINLAPGNYTVIIATKENVTIYYDLTTILPHVFNGASLSYLQTASHVIKLLDVTPSQKTSIDNYIASNATAAATFKNYTESYTNGNVSFTEGGVGTSSYVVSNLSLINNNATITASTTCGASHLAGGVINRCIQNSSLQTEKLPYIFNSNTTGGGGIFNYSTMAQIKNGTYAISGIYTTVHQNQMVTVPAGTFDVYYINATLEHLVNSTSSAIITEQAWVNASGVIDKFEVIEFSLNPQPTAMGDWKGTFLSNITLMLSLSGSNITQSQPKTIASTNYTTSIVTSNQSSATPGQVNPSRLTELIVVGVVIAAFYYGLYRIIKRQRSRSSAKKPSSKPAELKKRERV